MPQQTKTEALEELARLIRRDIMNGTARLNETWWFDDDTRMQDRIAHVLLDYSDEAVADDHTRRINGMVEELRQRDETITELAVERDQLHRQMVSFVENPSQISTPFGLLDINSNGMRRLLDEITKLRDERDHIKAQFDTAFGEQRERAFDKMAKPLVEEQGPWVVMREVRGGFHYYTDPTVDDWGTSLHEAKQFDSKLTADVIAAETTKDYRSKWFVRTVDEAGGQ